MQELFLAMLQKTRKNNSIIGSFTPESKSRKLSAANVIRNIYVCSSLSMLDDNLSPATPNISPSDPKYKPLPPQI